MDYVEVARKVLARLEASAEPETANETVASIALLRTFPHCPRCASYALYRPNNIGNYQCQTCGLQTIAEDVARRTQ